MKRNRPLIGIVFAAATFVASPAFAQQPDAPPPGADVPPTTTTPAPPAAPDSAEEKAREHYRRGLELYDEGDHRLALVEFERAYSTVPNYKLLYNIGQVHFKLNHYAQARLSLEKYLQEGASAIPAARRTDVEQDLATLRTRTALITIRSNIPGADVRINNVVVGKAPLERFLVDAGPLKVEVSASGFSQNTRDVTLAGSDDHVVSMELSATNQSITAPQPRSEEHRGISRATIGWIATGVLAAGAIGTGVAALVSSKDYDSDRRSASDGSPEDTKSELERERNTVRALSIATDALAAATLVAGGISLYFTLHDSHRTSTPAAAAASATSPRLQLRGSSVTFQVGF